MLTRALLMLAFAALTVMPACSGSGNGPDDKGCCPPDPTMSSCMHIGGYSAGSCQLTCDFFCSTNWRLEADSHGCSMWRYETRAPQPGENQLCMATPDGGADAGAD